MESGELGNKVIVPLSYYEDGKVYFLPASSGIVGFMYNEIEFKDTEGRWMNDDVKYLASRGVIKGIGGGMFAPDANIIRADAVTMIIRMLGLNAGSNDNFADVDPTKYYADAVATAKALGIVNGVGGNMFKPDAEIIREDIFVMLYRAMAKYQKIPETPEYKNIIFNDQDQIADYAKEAVETFTKMGIIQGNGGYLKPKDKATRGEVAKMLRNIMEYFMK